jgi:hypothetical protein
MAGMKLVAAGLLLLAAAPAQATGLTVRAGETWIFVIRKGEPAQARKVPPSAKIAKGQIKVSVRAMMGTTMIVTNNSPIAYSFRAELLKDGKIVAPRPCTLPANAKPIFEQWPQKADAVRIGKFTAATAAGRC